MASDFRELQKPYGEYADMNKKLAFLALLAVIASTGFYAFTRSGEDPIVSSEEAEVREVVKDFGKKLKMVSLSAPADDVRREIEAQYGEFISADLLDAWKSEPSRAPGRFASSPWPDRIEISGMEKDPEGAYEVGGLVVELSSTEQVSGGVAAQYPVGLKLRKQDGRWVITGFVKALSQ